MATIELDHELYQGASYRWRMRFFEADGVTPLDLTSIRIRGDIRKSYTSATAYPWTIIKLDQNVEAEVGYCYAELYANDTDGMEKGSYVYDVEIEINNDGVENNTDVEKAYVGKVLIKPEVTKRA